MAKEKRILVTGATGKVGQAFINRVLNQPGYESVIIRALCHNRTLDQSERLEVVKGSMEQRNVVDKAIQGVTHVLHLATSKETPESERIARVSATSEDPEKGRTGP